MAMVRRLVFLVLLSLSGLGQAGLGSQTEVPVSLFWTSPNSAGLGFEDRALQSLRDAYLQDVRDGKLPGVNLLISRKGQHVLKASIGFADLEERKALSFGHLFRLYSMTKPIASVLSLQQIEAGLYGLDTPVDTFLPELSKLLVYDPQVGTKKRHAQMSVRHLLTHTAGFTAVWNQDPVASMYREQGVVEYLPNEFENAPASLTDFYSRISRLPLLHEPGMRRTYGVSNDVQGVLVERAAGSEVVEILQASMLGPLGMRDTFFCVPRQELFRLASLYAYSQDGKLNRVEKGDEASYECPVALSSLSGGLVGSISDYWKFAEAIRRGGKYGEARILSPKSVELLLQPQADVDEGSEWIPGAEWGLGVAIVVNPSKSVRMEVKGNVYWSGSANTSFWIDPTNQLVALIFTQVRGSHPEFSVRTDFRDRVYSVFRGADHRHKRF